MNIGAFSMGLNRLATHYGKVNYILILYIALKSGLPVYWLLIIFTVAPLIMFLDLKFLYRKELEYSLVKNELLIELLNNRK